MKVRFIVCFFCFLIIGLSEIIIEGGNDIFFEYICINFVKYLDINNINNKKVGQENLLYLFLQKHLTTSLTILFRIRMSTICSVGKIVGTVCNGSRTHKKGDAKPKTVNLIQVSSLNATKEIWPFTQASFHETACQNICEKWLIEKRIGKKLAVDDSICPKHREDYGFNWKCPRACLYPGHKTKSKFDLKWRKMSPLDILQAEMLYSSSAKRVHIPIGEYNTKEKKIQK